MKPSNIGPGGSEEPFLFVGPSLVETSSQELVVLGVGGGGKDTLIMRLYQEKYWKTKNVYLISWHQINSYPIRISKEPTKLSKSSHCSIRPKWKMRGGFYHALRAWTTWFWINDISLRFELEVLWFHFFLESELESESWAKELESELHGIGSKVESIPGLESVPWLESILNVKRLQSINTSMRSYFWLLS